MPTVRIAPQRILLCQLLAIACLGLGHACATVLYQHTELFQHTDIRTLLDLDAESGLGTWYSALSILACAITAYILSRHEEAKASRRFWGGAALLAAFLALDEAVGIHEHFTVIGKLLTSGDGIFRVSWWAPYLLALAPIVVAMAPGLLRLDAATRNRLVVAGGIYVAAAVGLEIIESSQYDAFLHQHGLLQGADADWARVAPIIKADAVFMHDYSLLVLVEETLEMLGVALALRALAMHAAQLNAQFALVFQKPDAKASRPDKSPGATQR
jgi:hypothetical protein